jgi:hypothetical protein
LLISVVDADDKLLLIFNLNQQQQQWEQREQLICIQMKLHQKNETIQTKTSTCTHRPWYCQFRPRSICTSNHTFLYNGQLKINTKLTSLCEHRNPDPMNSNQLQLKLQQIQQQQKSIQLSIPSEFTSQHNHIPNQHRYPIQTTKFQPEANQNINENETEFETFPNITNYRALSPGYQPLIQTKRKQPNPTSISSNWNKKFKPNYQENTSLCSSSSISTCAPHQLQVQSLFDISPPSVADYSILPSTKLKQKASNICPFNYQSNQIQVSNITYEAYQQIAVMEVKHLQKIETSRYTYTFIFKLISKSIVYSSCIWFICIF